MLTRTQIEGAATEELEDLAGRIEAELTRRALDDRRGGEGGREVVEERAAPRGTYRRELVRCGKERCKKCAEGPAHGPYWYHYFRRGGRLTSRYVGKELGSAGAASSPAGGNDEELLDAAFPPSAHRQGPREGDGRPGHASSLSDRAPGRTGE